MTNTGEAVYWGEWLLPQGFADAANVVLHPPGSGAPRFCSQYCRATVSMVGDDMRRRIDHIVPHMQRALRISTAIGLKHMELVTLASSLDGLSTAVFLVDAAS